MQRASTVVVLSYYCTDERLPINIEVSNTFDSVCCRRVKWQVDAATQWHFLVSNQQHGTILRISNIETV